MKLAQRPNKLPTLIGENIVLKVFSPEEDAEELYQLSHGDKQVAEAIYYYTPFGPFKTLEDFTKHYTENYEITGYTVTLKETGEKVCFFNFDLISSHKLHPFLFFAFILFYFIYLFDIRLDFLLLWLIVRNTIELKLVQFGIVLNIKGHLLIQNLSFLCFNMHLRLLKLGELNGNVIFFF